MLGQTTPKPRHKSFIGKFRSVGPKDLGRCKVDIRLASVPDRTVHHTRSGRWSALLGFAECRLGLAFAVVAVVLARRRRLRRHPCKKIITTAAHSRGICALNPGAESVTERKQPTPHRSSRPRHVVKKHRATLYRRRGMIIKAWPTAFLSCTRTLRAVMCPFSHTCTSLCLLAILNESRRRRQQYHSKPRRPHFVEHSSARITLLENFTICPFWDTFAFTMLFPNLSTTQTHTGSCATHWYKHKLFVNPFLRFWLLLFWWFFSLFTEMEEHIFSKKVQLSGTVFVYVSLVRWSRSICRAWLLCSLSDTFVF